jgi:hypothetical protein
VFRDLIEAAAETVLARYRDALARAPEHASPDAAALLARRRRTQASSRLAPRAFLARVVLDVSSLNSPSAAERTAGGAFSEGRL